MTGNVRGMIAKVYASRCRLVLAVRNGRLGSREADFRVGAVAKRLVGRAAASTHRKWALRNLISVAIPIDECDVITFNEIRTVLPDLDVCHLPNLLNISIRWLRPSNLNALHSPHHIPTSSFSASTGGNRRSISFCSSGRAAVPSPPPVKAE